MQFNEQNTDEMVGRILKVLEDMRWFSPQVDGTMCALEKGEIRDTAELTKIEEDAKAAIELSNLLYFKEMSDKYKKNLAILESMKKAEEKEKDTEKGDMNSGFVAFYV